MLYASQSDTLCGTAGANCGACSQPTPDCHNGSCGCQETSCTGPPAICTLLTTTSNCSACGDKCNLTNAASATCNGTKCSYTCNTGDSDCNSSVAPDTDGCECATPACCGTSCETTHNDGVGQSYYDCDPLYANSPTCTYSQAAATEACDAYATAQGHPTYCELFDPCTTGTVRTYTICYTDGHNNAVNYCWGFTCGTDSGWIESTTCPATQQGSSTWN